MLIVDVCVHTQCTYVHEFTIGTAQLGSWGAFAHLTCLLLLLR